MSICEYGCKGIGKYFFEYSKKWCCENSYNKCPAMKLKLAELLSKRTDIKEKRKATYIKKYGVEHPMLSEKIKNKMKHTMKEKYGVEYIMMNDEMKKKSKQTQIQKYGKFYTQTDAYKEKTKKTCMKKYGVDSPNKSEIVKTKKEKSFLKNWGKRNGFQSEEIKNKSKNTMLEKYGVEYNLQRADMMKYQYAIKKYTMPSGRIVSIQGNEGIVIDNLLKKYNENDIFIEDIDIEKQIGDIWYSDNNKKHRYFPDIFIKSKNKIIEVKSKYTYKANEKINLLKKEACLRNGFNFEFTIIR